jgi:hypothetical protein
MNTRYAEGRSRKTTAPRASASSSMRCLARTTRQPYAEVRVESYGVPICITRLGSVMIAASRTKLSSENHSKKSTLLGSQALEHPAYAPKKRTDTAHALIVVER